MTQTYVVGSYAGAIDRPASFSQKFLSRSVMPEPPVFQEFSALPSCDRKNHLIIRLEIVKTKPYRILVLVAVTNSNELIRSVRENNHKRSSGEDAVLKL